MALEIIFDERIMCIVYIWVFYLLLVDIIGNSSIFFNNNIFWGNVHDIVDILFVLWYRGLHRKLYLRAYERIGRKNHHQRLKTFKETEKRNPETYQLKDRRIRCQLSLEMRWLGWRIKITRRSFVCYWKGLINIIVDAMKSFSL